MDNLSTGHASNGGESPLWEVQPGVTVPLSELDDLYLLSIFARLTRMGFVGADEVAFYSMEMYDKELDFYPCYFDGYLESTVYRVLESTVHPLYDAIHKEIEKRKIALTRDTGIRYRSSLCSDDGPNEYTYTDFNNDGLDQ